MIHEYTIMRETLNSGKVLLTPVVRRKQKRFLYDNSWERISCIYGIYINMDLPFTPELTEEECNEHIAGYKAKIASQESLKVRDVKYDKIQEVII